MKCFSKIVLAAAGLGSGLLLAEGLTRCVLPFPTRQIALLRMRAPDLQMDAGTDLKKPGYNPFLQRRPYSEWICDGKKPERMNNEGFRDCDFVISKDVGRTRIAILGDSFTEGWMVSRSVAFPRILEFKLGPGFEVLNFGLANRSPLRYLALYNQIVRKYHPDAVLVCLYRNDVAEDAALRPYVTWDGRGIPHSFDYTRYFRHTPRMPQTKWEKRRDKWQWYLCRYSRLYPYVAVALAVDPEFRKQILEMPPSPSFDQNWADTAAYLETLEKLVEGDGGLYLLAYVPDQNDFQLPDPLCSRAQCLAMKKQIPFFYPRDFISPAHVMTCYIPGDGHFSSEGHRCYAEELAPWLKRLARKIH